MCAKHYLKLKPAAITMQTEAAPTPPQNVTPSRLIRSSSLEDACNQTYFWSIACVAYESDRHERPMS